MRYATLLLSAVLFGVGLGLGGMLDPTRVVGFLDVTGVWDPSLVFVMGGALGVNAIAYRLTRRRAAPVFDDHFDLPTRHDFEPRLIWGSVLFGVGWGLSGYCPGPAIVTVVDGTLEAFLFLGAMALGVFAASRTASGRFG